MLCAAHSNTDYHLQKNMFLRKEFKRNRTMNSPSNFSDEQKKSSKLWTEWLSLEALVRCNSLEMINAMNRSWSWCFLSDNWCTWKCLRFFHRRFSVSWFVGSADSYYRQFLFRLSQTHFHFLVRPVFHTINYHNYYRLIPQQIILPMLNIFSS